MNAILIHGACGNPGENWFPWLRKELEKLGFSVYAPQFPTPEGQKLANWMEVFEGFKQYLNPDTILIGHSLGCPFILNVLERLDSPVNAVFFVSGFIGKLGCGFDDINKTFAEKHFKWEKIKSNCRKFFLYNSDNDPYVPLDKAKELASNLDVEFMLIKQGGHIGKKAGFTEFQPLLTDIRRLLSGL